MNRTALRTPATNWFTTHARRWPATQATHRVTH